MWTERGLRTAPVSNGCTAVSDGYLHKATMYYNHIDLLLVADQLEKKKSNMCED